MLPLFELLADKAAAGGGGGGGGGGAFPGSGGAMDGSGGGIDGTGGAAGGVGDTFSIELIELFFKWPDLPGLVGGILGAA